MSVVGVPACRKITNDPTKVVIPAEAERAAAVFRGLPLMKNAISA